MTPGAEPAAARKRGAAAEEPAALENPAELHLLPATGSSPNRAYLPAIDHLRALAAITIVFYHGFQLLSADLVFHRPFSDDQWIHTRNPLLAYLIEGHTAVAAFMVLSGFILVQGTLGRELNYGSFLRNRILRIYPLYGALLAVGLCAHWPDISLSGLALSILPLGNFSGAAALGPFSGMQWTIAVEFQFYLIFPFLLRFLNTRHWSFFLQLIALLIILRLTAVLLGADARNLGYWTILGRLDQFLIGMLAGKYFALRPRGPARRPLTAFAAATIALLAVLYLFHRAGGYPMLADWKILWPTIEGVAWVGFILCYIPAAAYLPARVAMLLQRIGLVSFSIYLLHIIVITVVSTRGWHLGLIADGHYEALLETVLIVLPLTLALAMLTYVTIEEPFLALRRRYT